MQYHYIKTPYNIYLRILFNQTLKNILFNKFFNFVLSSSLPPYSLLGFQVPEVSFKCFMYLGMNHRCGFIDNNYWKCLDGKNPKS